MHNVCGHVLMTNNRCIGQTDGVEVRISMDGSVQSEENVPIHNNRTVQAQMAAASTPLMYGQLVDNHGSL